MIRYRPQSERAPVSMHRLAKHFKIQPRCYCSIASGARGGERVRKRTRTRIQSLRFYYRCGAGSRFRKPAPLYICTIYGRFTVRSGEKQMRACVNLPPCQNRPLCVMCMYIIPQKQRIYRTERDRKKYGFSYRHGVVSKSASFLHMSRCAFEKQLSRASSSGARGL